MFACCYQDKIWNLLVEKCSNSATHIMTEKEYKTYQKEQERIEEETYQNNGYYKKTEQI